MPLSPQHIALAITQVDTKIAPLVRDLQYLDTQISLMENGLTRGGPDYKIGMEKFENFFKSFSANGFKNGICNLDQLPLEFSELNGLKIQSEEIKNKGLRYSFILNHKTLFIASPDPSVGTFLIPREMFAEQNKTVIRQGMLMAELARRIYFTGQEWFVPNNDLDEISLPTEYSYPSASMLNGKSHLNPYPVLGIVGDHENEVGNDLKGGDNPAVDSVIYQQDETLGTVSVNAGFRSFDNRIALHGGMVSMNDFKTNYKGATEQLYQRLLKKNIEEGIEEGSSSSLFEKNSDTAQWLLDEQITIDQIIEQIELSIKAAAAARPAARELALFAQDIATFIAQADSTNSLSFLIDILDKVHNGTNDKIKVAQAHEAALQLRCGVWAGLFPQKAKAVFDNLTAKFKVRKMIPNASDPRNDRYLSRMTTTPFVAVMSKKELAEILAKGGLKQGDTEEMRNNRFYDLQDFIGAFCEHPFIVFDMAAELRDGRLTYTEGLHGQYIVALEKMIFAFKKFEATAKQYPQQFNLVVIAEKIKEVEQTLGVFKTIKQQASASAPSSATGTPTTTGTGSVSETDPLLKTNSINNDDDDNNNNSNCWKKCVLI